MFDKADFDTSPECRGRYFLTSSYYTGGFPRLELRKVEFGLDFSCRCMMDYCDNTFRFWAPTPSHQQARLLAQKWALLSVRGLLQERVQLSVLLWVLG